MDKTFDDKIFYYLQNHNETKSRKKEKKIMGGIQKAH